MSRKLSAIKEYMKNSYLYTSKQIKKSRYVGTLKMRFWKSVLMIDDLWLWIDEYLNHGFFEYLVQWNYWLWKNTSQKFCMWACDNFEDFENE